MEVRKQNFDKAMQLNVKERHKSHIESVSAKLIAYYSDPAKKFRQKEKHLCKYCNYFDTARIGGCAITLVGCANCGKEMSFANTCTDVYCDEYAEKLNVCKHCGQKMD